VRRLPLWILGAALGSFAAGMNLGPALHRGFGAADAAAVADDDLAYVRRLVEDYGLTRAQERSLRMVISTRNHEELEVLRTAQAAAELPPSIQNPIRAVRARAYQRIRALLDDEQRRRFDDASGPPQNR
jgi:hypothetical protein